MDRLAVFIILMLLVFLWSFIDLSSCLQVFAPVENRELGLTEITQAAVLVGIICLTFLQFLEKIKINYKEGAAWVIFSLFLTFIFLEEVDYGLHYYDHFMGNEAYTTSLDDSFRNVHNQGNNNIVIKTIIVIFQIILFGIILFL